LLFKEHQTVEIRKDLSHLSLEAGASGVVVHVYPNGVAYEVEFIGEDGRTLGVETMEYDELTPQQIAGIRADAEKHLPSGRVISRQSLFSDVLPDLHITCTQELDGRHLAEVPELPGVMCHGPTSHEAMAKGQALALRVLAERLELGESVASSFTFRI